MKKPIFTFLIILAYQASQAQLPSNIDAYVQPLVVNKDFSGFILVSKNDSVVYNKGFGLANQEWNEKNSDSTVFHIASLTKQFTAAAILICEQDGLLSLEDPIGKYIDDYPNGNRISIEHLLSQRSGIPDYNNLDGYDEMSLKEVSLRETIDWFKDQSLLFEPGAKYEYSNANFILAARIIEVVSGMAYSDFLDKKIFEVLSMNQTGNFRYSEIVKYQASGYEPSPDGIANSPYYNKSFKLGSGSLYSTAADLYKWDRALYSNKILSEKSKSKLFNDYGNNYGLGWGVYQNDDVGKFVSHDGKSPGFFAYMKRYMNHQKIGIIILSNINSGIMNDMKSDITNIVFDKNFTIYEPYKIKPTPKNLEEYTGKYDFPPKFNFTIVEKDKELYFQWMDTPFLQYLTPIGKDEFMMRSRYDYLKFIRNDEGKISAIEYKQNSDTTVCPKL